MKRRINPHLLEIGSRIRARRVQLRLKQKDLAQELGLTQGMYTNFERGVSEMSSTQLAIVSKVLGISTDDLGSGPAVTEKNPLALAQENVRQLQMHLGRLEEILATKRSKNESRTLENLMSEEFYQCLVDISKNNMLIENLHGYAKRLASKKQKGKL
jgi:transcriptional regulator with XRE-family HTH domain